MTPIHLIAEIYAVELPGNAYGFEFDNSLQEGDMVYYLDYPSVYNFRWLSLPEGTWQIICTTKECGEVQAKEIVHSSEWFFPVKHTRYVDYKYPYDRENKQRWSEGFGSALGSLISLLETKSLNPETNYLIIKKVS